MEKSGRVIRTCTACVWQPAQDLDIIYYYAQNLDINFTWHLIWMVVFIYNTHLFTWDREFINTRTCNWSWLYYDAS